MSFSEEACVILLCLEIKENTDTHCREKTWNPPMPIRSKYPLDKLKMSISIGYLPITCINYYKYYYTIRSNNWTNSINEIN